MRISSIIHCDHYSGGDIQWDQSQCPHVPQQASGAITGSTVVGGQGDREGV